MLIADIDAPRAVVEELRAGFHAHAALASVRQERLNEALRRIENASRLVDGIGQLQYRIDADLYWHMRQLHGAECWRDPEFLKDCERKGLIQRVKGVSDKVRVGFGSAKAE